MDVESQEFETVQDAARGDPVAVEDLLQRHLSGLRAFVRLRMGPELRAKESASDLVQSACREVLTNLENFRYRSDKQFRCWLFTTALRKVKNKVQYYRAARRDVRREDARQGPDNLESLANIYAQVSTPSQGLALRERVEQLEKAFAEMSEAHREVITLAKVVGLSHREIAAAMGRTESATRVLLFRALAELGYSLGIRPR